MVSPSTHRLSWGLLYAALVTAMSVLMSIIATYTALFPNSDFFVIFFLIFLYGISSVSATLLWTPRTRRQSWSVFSLSFSALSLLQIFFSFMLTPLFKKPKFASTVGSLLTVVFGCLSLFTVLMTDFPQPLVWLLCLLSPTAFSMGIAQVTRLVLTVCVVQRLVAPCWDLLLFVSFLERWCTWRLRETVQYSPPWPVVLILCMRLCSCCSWTVSSICCWPFIWNRCCPVSPTVKPGLLPSLITAFLFNKLWTLTSALLEFLKNQYSICRWVWNETVFGLLPETVLLVQTDKALCGSELGVRRRGERWRSVRRRRLCGAGFTWVQRKGGDTVKNQVFTFIVWRPDGLGERVIGWWWWWWWCSHLEHFSLCSLFHP